MFLSYLYHKGPIEVLLVILAPVDGESCITLAGLGRIKLSSARLKISIEEEFFILGSSWFQLEEQEGTNVYLKRSVLKLGTVGARFKRIL